MCSNALWYQKDFAREKKTSIKLSLIESDFFLTFFPRPDLMPLDDCKLLFVNEVFGIEKPGTQINEFDDTFDPSASPVKSRLT